MAALAHPTLRHPRTGAPLEAVGIVRGRPVWPILGAEDAPPAPPAPPAPAPPAPPAATDTGFPAGTPVEQMTVEQQAAYWKHYARQHETRAKQFGKLTPEELTALREKADKHDALELELSSDADKREKIARETAQAEADGKYRPLLAETAFRVAIGDRKTQDEVDDFIADLNLPRFLTDDGHVDTAKVLARVDQFAPATGTQQQRPGPSANGQGNRSGNRAAAGGHNVAAGRDLYEQLHPAKK